MYPSFHLDIATCFTYVCAGEGKVVRFASVES